MDIFPHHAPPFVRVLHWTAQLRAMFMASWSRHCMCARYAARSLSTCARASGERVTWCVVMVCDLGRSRS